MCILNIWSVNAKCTPQFDSQGTQVSPPSPQRKANPNKNGSDFPGRVEPV